MSSMLFIVRQMENARPIRNTRRINQSLREDIHRLRDKGMPMQAIAYDLETSENTVRRALRQRRDALG